MKKKQQMIIDNTAINVIKINDDDYISLTDMLKAKDENFLLSNWLRNRNTLEFLSVWEQMHNQDFNYVEFDLIKSEAGLNTYKISVKEWTKKTNAIGLVAKAGRYGGTYAHKDIAFEFASWISPTFKLYLIKEFQRLKEIESNEHNLEWNVKRLISKTNYHLQTEAVKEHIIPQSVLPLNKQNIEYANEADVLNMAVFGCTAKQWRKENPQRASNGENIRDMASINELAVLSTLEAVNADMIKEEISRDDRLDKLEKMARNQLSTLNRMSDDKKTLKKIGESVFLDEAKQIDFNSNEEEEDKT